MPIILRHGDWYVLPDGTHVQVNYRRMFVGDEWQLIDALSGFPKYLLGPDGNSLLHYVYDTEQGLLVLPCDLQIADLRRANQQFS